MMRPGKGCTRWLRRLSSSKPWAVLRPESRQETAAISLNIWWGERRVQHEGVDERERIYGVLCGELQGHRGADCLIRYPGVRLNSIAGLLFNGRV